MSKDQITEQTRVSLGTMATILATVLGGVLWQNNKLNAIEHAIERSWTVDQHQLWADRLKSANPSLRVPSVESVRSGNRDRDTVEAGPTLGLKQ